MSLCDCPEDTLSLDFKRNGTKLVKNLAKCDVLQRPSRQSHNDIRCVLAKLNDIDKRMDAVNVDRIGVLYT